MRDIKLLRAQRHRYDRVRRLKNRIPFYFCIKYGGSNLSFWRIRFYKTRSGVL